jgi:hypothetical protein
MNKIQQELEMAAQARAAGNEGKARVCARRAAGLAIREHYRRARGAGWGGDAYAQLVHLREDDQADAALRAAAARLTTKVDHDHQLPFSQDPLDDARLIVSALRAGRDD